jgi:Uma2 family endonuclease
MAQETPRVKLTYRDLVLFPDDGKRHELIDGEHYVTPSPSTRHQRVLTRLLVSLNSYLTSREMGEVFPSPYDVVLSEFDVVEPDLLVVTPESAGKITEANLQGAPDLVVEILSPSTKGRDRVLKLRLYEKFGVREYWIVDPVGESVEVLRPVEGRLVAVESLGRDDELTSPLFPKLAIRLGSVFAT